MWYDRWLFEVPLVDLLSINDPSHMLLAEFFDDKGCNVEKLRHWVPAHLLNQIQEIHLFQDQYNYMVWVGSASRDFSIKSAWEIIRQKRNTSLIDGFLWNNLLPLKLSFFAWKVLRNLVPLDVTLKRREVSMASRCSCCLSQEESLAHLFMTGPIAMEVWSSF